MINELKAELVADPLGLGYVGMTSQQVADNMNALVRTQPRIRLDASEVFQAIDINEFNALTDVRQQKLLMVLGFGILNLWGREGDLFAAYFGAQSATGAALVALRSEPVSRATEIGLPAILPGYVEEARKEQ